MFPQFTTHHGHSVGAQKLLWAQCCGIGHVGKHIDKCDHRDGDEDGTRQIPQRLREEVERVTVTHDLNAAAKFQVYKAEKLCLLMRVDQLLCDVVEEVPASVGEGALQERQCDQANVIIPEGLESMCRLQPVVVTWGPRRPRKDLKNSNQPHFRLFIFF